MFANITKEKANSLFNLSSNIKKRVIGQDEVIDDVTNAITVSQILPRKNKPLGSFLFLGPTGVGKTELTKALAIELLGSKEKLIRFDMSEFNSKSSLVSKFPDILKQKIGDSGQPNILLFDEIEKADSTIYDYFLQLLDEGVINGSDSSVVNFYNSYIVLTSNLADEIISEKAIYATKTPGFMNLKTTKDDILNVVGASFRPEMINRFDHIEIFNPMTKEVTRNIVELKFKEFLNELTGSDIKILVSKDENNSYPVLDYLSKKSYDFVNGARPVNRIINDEIKLLVSEKLIENILNDIDVNTFQIEVEGKIDKKTNLKSTQKLIIKNIFKS